MISAPGYRTLVTHLFLDGDKYLESAAVFGVKPSLIIRPTRIEGVNTARRVPVRCTFGQLRSQGRAGPHIIELLSHYAELHRALQMPENDVHIDTSTYLENLCLSISRSKLVGVRIDLVLTASPLRLPSERRWRLGMIVYELVTNAARHAFGNGNGEIRVELSRAGKFVECRVVDNGGGETRESPP
jgi:signal transduction histidine kinase